MARKRPKLHPKATPEIVRRARALRQDMTPAERILWERLRDHRFLRLQFRRQHPIHRYIVDFYCPARLLVVEIDGGTHERQKEYDAERTAWLEAHGYRVVRFRNDDVERSLGDVMQALQEACEVE